MNKTQPARKSDATISKKDVFEIIVLVVVVFAWAFIGF